MTSEIRPWPSIERALLQLIVEWQVYEFSMDEDAALGRVGGDLAYDGVAPWYIRIDRVPGGASDRTSGTFVIDLEVFSKDYSVAESVANDLEALVFQYPHVVEVDGRKVVLDTVTQNSGPHALPWEDELVTRLGATYVITARRR